MAFIIAKILCKFNWVESYSYTYDGSNLRDNVCMNFSNRRGEKWTLQIQE